MTNALLEGQRGTVDKDALLGRILWYTVPMTTCLDPKIVGQVMKDLGFTRRIPSPPAESDVFRRVTAKAERKKIPVDGTNHFENWLIREVNDKRDNTLVRRIVVETVDPEGKTLSYDQIVDVEFSYDPTVKPNRGIMTVNWINGFDEHTHPRAAELVEEIQSEFARWKDMYHEGVMRHWIKQTIIDMGATSVRPTGGIYFLEEKFAGKVEALETFISDHFPQNAECHSVEIPDTKKQREMIRRAIIAETTGAMDDMMVKIAEVKASGKLTPKKQLAMISEVKKLENKIGNYSKLLESDLSAIRSRGRLLQGLVSGLSTGGADD